MRQRSALLQLQMALSLVLALVLNIIFSNARVLVLNQPIIKYNNSTFCDTYDGHDITAQLDLFEIEF